MQTSLYSAEESGLVKSCLPQERTELNGERHWTLPSFNVTCSAGLRMIPSEMGNQHYSRILMMSGNQSLL